MEAAASWEVFMIDKMSESEIAIGSLHTRLVVRSIGIFPIRRFAGKVIRQLFMISCFFVTADRIPVLFSAEFDVKLPCLTSPNFPN